MYEPNDYIQHQCANGKASEYFKLFVKKENMEALRIFDKKSHETETEQKYVFELK